MKKIAILALALSLLLVGIMAVPVLADPPTTVTVSWLEDAIRYYPDGTVHSQWIDDPMGPMEFLKTGNAYHAVDIAQFYNYFPLPDLEGSMIISGKGNLSGRATYTYPVLPLKNRFMGNVTIDPVARTMTGTYTQYRYVFGSQEDVIANYPYAIPEKSSKAAGWWYIGQTDYTAH